MTNTFTVMGRGDFPTDMLRYDQCWPSTSEDAVAMQFNRSYGESFSVVLDDGSRFSISVDELRRLTP